MTLLLKRGDDVIPTDQFSCNADGSFRYVISASFAPKDTFTLLLDGGDISEAYSTEFTVPYDISAITNVTVSGDSETGAVTFSGLLADRPAGMVVNAVLETATGRKLWSGTTAILADGSFTGKITGLSLAEGDVLVLKLSSERAESSATLFVVPQKEQPENGSITELTITADVKNQTLEVVGRAQPAAERELTVLVERRGNVIYINQFKTDNKGAFTFKFPSELAAGDVFNFQFNGAKLTEGVERTVVIPDSQFGDVKASADAGEGKTIFSGTLENRPNTEVEAVLKDANGKELWQGIVTTDVNGKFSGETSKLILTVGESLTLTLQALHAETYSKSFTVTKQSQGNSGGGPSSNDLGDKIPIGHSNVQATVTKQGDTVTLGISDSDAGKAVQSIGPQESLTLDVSKQAGVTTLSVPQNILTALDQLNKQRGSTSSVNIVLPGAKISINSRALSAIVSQSNGGAVTISVKKLDSSTQLTPVQQTAVGTHPVYDLSVYAGSTRVSDLGGGSITVSLPYTLVSGESAAGITVYYLDSNGKLNMITSSGYDPATGMVTFTVSHLSLCVILYHEFPFGDVHTNDWFFGAVKYMYEKGVFTGVSKTNFAPSITMNRAMFVTVLGHLANATVDQSKSSGFKDVVKDGWSNGYIVWATQAGIVHGYGNSLFGQYDSITREQMALIMYNYAKFAGYDVSNTSATKLNSFNDVSKIDSWAVSAMAWTVNNGILNGVGGNSLAPTEQATRAQVAQVILSLTNALGSK